MRPRNLDEFLGQRHFLGPDKLLKRMLEADRLSSLLFYGPPGVGKTSLAAVIANYTKAKFYYLNAPAASVKDIREIIIEATDRLNGMLGRLLDFARPAQIRKRPCDLRAEAEAIVEFVRAEDPQAGERVRVDVPDEARMALADQTRSSRCS